MDNTTLESSIKKESEERIADILEKEADAIRRQDEEYAENIACFRGKIAAETQARMDQELSRLENRAVLERKKLALASVETFISRMVDEVMKEIRQSPGYRAFLVDAATRVADRISGTIDVRLSPEDMALEEDIRTAILAAGKHGLVEISADKSIGRGGCAVVDESGGRVYNRTLERIYFRKAALIRRKAVKILREYTGGMERKER